MAYLVEHRTAVPQFHAPRRARPIGVIGVHTAESVMDSVGPDTGAENVARYMTTRTDPGSYHDLVDSDSIVDLVPYTAEAFHIATHRLNRVTTGLSFACRTADWVRMSTARRRAFLVNGALAAARQAAYHQKAGGLMVPARRITLADALAGRPGFLAHADADPARRSDPGDRFPWAEFFAEFAAHVHGRPPGPSPLAPSTPSQGGTPMSAAEVAEIKAHVTREADRVIATTIAYGGKRQVWRRADGQIPGGIWIDDPDGQRLRLLTPQQWEQLRGWGYAEVASDDDLRALASGLGYPDPFGPATAAAQ